MTVDSFGAAYPGMQSSEREIVDKAISQRLRATVSFPIENQSELHSRTLCVQLADRTFEGFSILTDSLPDEIVAAIAPGARAAFSFGIANSVVQFQADLLSADRDASRAVVRCGLPTDISIRQRREHFRAPVVEGAPLDVVVWKVPPHWVLRDRPKPSMQLKIEMLDLSLGGMCIALLPHRIGPDQISLGDRLRVQITAKGEEAVLDSVIVHRSPRSDGSLKIGVAFRKLENTIEGRRAAQILNQVVAALQRMNIRFKTAIPA